MKNLKPIVKACLLMLLLFFASCKKDGAVKPDPIGNAPVTTTDLLDYSIVISLSSEEGLRIIYFNKDGNDIKATFDAVSARRILTVNLVNNTWTMDLNGNGSVIYTFNFGRDDKGQLAILGATYKKQDDASIKMQLALSKNADVQSFANMRFMNDANVRTYLKFSNDHNFAISDNVDYAGAEWASYYDLCPGAWKGTYNGVDYMGLYLAVPGQPAEMYIQKAGEAHYRVFEPK